MKEYLLASLIMNARLRALILHAAHQVEQLQIQFTHWMIVCFVCRQEISTELKVFVQHLKTVHSLHDRNATYTCMQQQCNQTFGGKYAFILKGIILMHRTTVSACCQECWYLREFGRNWRCITSRTRIYMFSNCIIRANKIGERLSMQINMPGETANGNNAESISWLVLVLN